MSIREIFKKVKVGMRFLCEILIYSQVVLNKAIFTTVFQKIKKIKTPGRIRTTNLQVIRTTH